MNKEVYRQNSKEVLVLFSGGLDSILTSIKLIHSGHKVKLITFDNGSIVGIERVFNEAKRVMNIYTNWVEHVGVYSIWGLKQRFLDNLQYSKPIELANKYLNIPLYQMQCMCMQ